MRILRIAHVAEIDRALRELGAGNHADNMRVLGSFPRHFLTEYSLKKSSSIWSSYRAAMSQRSAPGSRIAPYEPWLTVPSTARNVSLALTGIWIRLTAEQRKCFVRRPHQSVLSFFGMPAIQKECLGVGTCKTVRIALWDTLQLS